MGPGFQRYPHPRLTQEMLPQGGYRGLYPTLFHPLASVGQHAVMAVTVAQIQTYHRQRLTRRRCHTTLFLANLLNGWSPLHPGVRIESLASGEASRLIPSK